jgi:hypothetical protein
MARTVRMPPQSELPKGPRREFVEELRRYYRAAGRPPLRKISRALEGRTELKEATASQETVRRLLRGKTLPTDWDRVYAVFFVLCEMGDIDPRADRWEDRYSGEETNTEYLQRLWDTALEEEPDLPSLPRPGRPIEDPRAADVGGSFGGSSAADEPPF